MANRKVIFAEYGAEKVKAIFNAKKEAAEEERKAETKNKIVPVLNPDGIAITVFGFLDAEAEAYLACGGTARYFISEKQLFFLEWYEEQYPTGELKALIDEAKTGTPCIYDWRNLQVLLTELVEDFKTSKDMSMSETEPQISLDDVPPHIRARLEAKIK